MLRPLLERFARSIAPHPSAEIRTVSPQPTRMTVVDGRELLLYLVPETRDEAEEVAIWTNTPAFARGHQIYFEEVWKRAQPIRDSRSPGRPARGPRAGTEDLSPVPPRRRRPEASSATDPAV